MELCSILCGSLDGRGVWRKTDTCICVCLSPFTVWNSQHCNQLYLQYKMTTLKQNHWMWLLHWEKQGWGCWVGPGLYGSRRRGALSPEGSGGQDCGNEAPGLQCLLHHLPIELCFTKHKLRDKITSGLWVQALNPNAGILLRLGLYTTVVISPFNHLLVCKIHSDISDFLILKTSTL